MKVFGPNDHDALVALKKYLNIQMVTADQRGFAISKKRVIHDMKFPLHLIPNGQRMTWLKKNFNLKKTIYMADGIFDGEFFEQVAYSIAPANAFYLTKNKADFVTKASGGDSAVAEACLHILKKFFKPWPGK